MERINLAFEIYHFDDFADNDKDNVDKDQDEIINSDLVTQLGTDGGTKLDEFSEKFQGGGGIFNQKIYFADFGPSFRAFFGRFSDEYLQHNFPKRRQGDQRPFGFFRKIIRFGTAICPLNIPDE